MKLTVAIVIVNWSSGDLLLRRVSGLLAGFVPSVLLGSLFAAKVAGRWGQLAPVLVPLAAGIR
jgi:hypothetical protein